MWGEGGASPPSPPHRCLDTIKCFYSQLTEPPPVPSCPLSTWTQGLFSEAAQPYRCFLPVVLRSLATLPHHQASQATPFQKQGLLLRLASSQLGPAGSQTSLSCENQENQESLEQTKPAYIFQNSELGLFYLLSLITDVRGLLTPTAAAPTGIPLTWTQAQDLPSSVLSALRRQGLSK